MTSRAASAGFAEPWTAFRSIDWPNSFRIVPASAFAGSVAPMTARQWATPFVALEDGDEDRARRHVGDEGAEEALPAVLGVEALGLGLRDPVPLQGDDAEALGLDPGEDLPGVPRLDGVGLDDRERLFQRGGSTFPERPSSASRPSRRGRVGRRGRRRVPERRFTFSAAVPLPPEMIAPACPIRRPGGAVRPAMKETTGFFRFAAIQAAASSSALPPISPIMMTASVSGSSLEERRARR